MLASGKERIRWYFNCKKWLPKREELIYSLKCVQEEEFDRIMKFAFRNDLRLSLIGRLMIRKCINEALTIPYDSFKLYRTEKGKPILKDAKLKSLSFDFNISHHGKYSVLASDVCSKVGVDVTRIDEIKTTSTNEYFKLMERIFTPSEWNFIKSGSSDYEKISRFYRNWCLKESFVKAEGIGIGFELRRISFKINTSQLNIDRIIIDTQVSLDNVLLSEWTFEESLLDNEHIVAVALYLSDHKRISENNHFQLIDFNHLISSAIPVNEVVSNNIWEMYCSKTER